LRQRTQQGKQRFKAVVVSGSERDGRPLAIVTVDLIEVALRHITEVLSVNRRQKPVIALWKIVLPAAVNSVADREYVAVHESPPSRANVRSYGECSKKKGLAERPQPSLGHYRRPAKPNPHRVHQQQASLAGVNYARETEVCSVETNSKGPDGVVRHEAAVVAHELAHRNVRSSKRHAATEREDSTNH
jgi:hypothetical protein